MLMYKIVNQWRKLTWSMDINPILYLFDVRKGGNQVSTKIF